MLADGGRYQGEWKEGLEEGNGKRLYPDGSMYEGQWSKGKRHGKGRCSVPSSKEVYQGNGPTMRGMVTVYANTPMAQSFVASGKRAAGCRARRIPRSPVSTDRV